MRGTAYMLTFPTHPPHRSHVTLLKWVPWLLLPLCVAVRLPAPAPSWPMLPLRPALASSARFVLIEKLLLI